MHWEYPRRPPAGIDRLAFDAGYWLQRARFVLVAPILLRWYNMRDALRSAYRDGWRKAVCDLHDEGARDEAA